MDAETYFLAVERTTDAYQGRLHRGDPGKAIVLENLELGPDAQITIDGQAHRLGTLVDKLTAFDTAFLRSHLDLRGQLALGAHLYRQSFGRIEPYVRQGDAGGVLGAGWQLGTFIPAVLSGSEVHSIVRVLDELRPITREHLEDFLAAYEISLPARRRDRELERILAETHGGYELTVEALKELQNRAWHLAEDVRSEETFLADGDFGL